MYPFHLLAFIGFFWPTGVYLHPFHVSVCEMEWNEKARRLEITHKIFWDDLEEGLKKMTGKFVNVSSPEDPEELNRLIGQYLDIHFSVLANGKKLKTFYLGGELEDEAMWCYVEVSDFDEFNEIEIRNTLLFDVFNDQMNLIHVKNKGKLKSLRLNQKNPSGTLKF